MPIPTTISCISFSKFISSRNLSFSCARPMFSKANSAAKTTVLFHGFVAKVVFSETRAWPPYVTHNKTTTTTTTRTRAFEKGDRDEGVRVLEQEALTDGSSQIGSNFVIYQLEPILNRLSKWFVSALFGAVILWRHDAEAIWAAMGSIINAILSVALKKIINQERPVPGIKSDPGMPSSHAQSIFFTVFFVVLSTLFAIFVMPTTASVIEWLGINGYTITFSGIALALGSYLSWLRISQQLHTVSQVVVGAIVGSIFSGLWYWLWGSFVQEAFISSLVVQLIITTGAIGFCTGFLLYVVRNWLRDER